MFMSAKRHWFSGVVLRYIIKIILDVTFFFHFVNICTSDLKAIRVSKACSALV